MNINKSTLIKFGLGFLIGLTIMFFIMKKEQTEVEVPIYIEVPVPVIQKEFDTIKLPIEIAGEKVIDSIYYKEYLQLKDSISKNNAYKEAITIREYNTPFEDDTIKIDTYNKVRGTLLETQVSYKTKPRTINLDTTLKVKIPTQTKFYIGGEVVLPTKPEFQNYSPSIAPGIIMKNKKETKLYKISYDPINKQFKAGIFFKL